MARSRNIKPGFFQNDLLVEMDFATRLMFAGLWCLADREGRLEDRPKKIKMGLFPADDVNVETMLADLHRYGFILRYEINGEKYIQIAKWSEHQNPHHTEKPSVIPSINGELTVKERLKNRGNQKPDGGNLADSGFLIPDSLIPDPLTADSELAPASMGGGGEEVPELHELPKPIAGSSHQLAPAVCFLMKKIGIGLVNPGHPKLNALLNAGVQVAQFEDAARRALAGGKTFAYAIGIVEREERDARDLVKALEKKRLAETPVESFAERAARQRVEEMNPKAARKAPSHDDVLNDFFTGKLVIDAETKPIAIGG